MPCGCRSSGPLAFEPRRCRRPPSPRWRSAFRECAAPRRARRRAAPAQDPGEGDEIRTGFYPTLSLTGGASSSSDTLTQVLQNPVGTLSATLALPFLEYNKTRLAIAGSQLDYQIAEAEFRKQLYSALVEVEDGLAARHHGEQRLNYLAEQLDFAKEAERLARARYQAGATGVQPWLDEQNRLWDAELALLGQQKEQLNTMARIYKALGAAIAADQSCLMPSHRARASGITHTAPLCAFSLGQGLTAGTQTN